MTVCVAAICNNNMIYGASDRMLASGDIQFEPEQTKIRPVTTSIVVMLAGDAGLQEDILSRVHDKVREWLDQRPNDWIPVRQIADWYQWSYGLVKLQRSASTLLSPLGLTHQTFNAQQQQMSPDLVNELARELINYELPTVGSIIAGVDTTGPHLFTTLQAEIACQAGVGFAAIGAGADHAASQFMFAGHTSHRDIAQTLLLTYAAKKRAEVAPGVGQDTDMFMVGPLVGSYAPIREEPTMKALDRIYKKSQQRIAKSNERAENDAKAFVEEIIKAAAAQAQEAAGRVPADK